MRKGIHMIELVIGIFIGFFVGVVLTCILLSKKAMKMKDGIENAAMDAKDSFIANYQMRMAAYDAKVAKEEAEDEDTHQEKTAE